MIPLKHVLMIYHLEKNIYTVHFFKQNTPLEKLLSVFLMFWGATSPTRRVGVCFHHKVQHFMNESFISKIEHCAYISLKISLKNRNNTVNEVTLHGLV